MTGSWEHCQNSRFWLCSVDSNWGNVTERAVAELSWGSVIERTVAELSRGSATERTVAELSWGIK